MVEHRGRPEPAGEQGLVAGGQVRPAFEVPGEVVVADQHEHVDVAEGVVGSGAETAGQPQATDALVGEEVVADTLDQLLLRGHPVRLGGEAQAADATTSPARGPASTGPRRLVVS